MSRFNRTPRKTEVARNLRRGETDVERRLWHRLRNGQICDAQFRRQHPAGRYILDFYCPALALAVELDGSQHAETGTRDHERDEWLKQKGVIVLRFWNSDVTENLNGVLEVIAAKIDGLRSAPDRSHPHWSGERTVDPHPARHSASKTRVDALMARRPPPFRGRERTDDVAPRAALAILNLRWAPSPRPAGFWADARCSPGTAPDRPARSTSSWCWSAGAR